MNRRAFFLGLLATAVIGLPDRAEAKRRRSGRRRRPRATPAWTGSRGTTNSGQCPCNGGDVCVGPRGGRYCITSSGNKRYGV